MAGGIIKSLKDIVDSLNKFFQFKVMTSAYDLKEAQPLKNIEINTWKKENNFEIIYLTNSLKNYFTLCKTIFYLRKETFYLNGIYSFKFFISPILIFQIFKKKSGLIIAPRGMVQIGALTLKRRKKELYISFLKKLPLLKHVTWHATSEQEKKDLIATFGSRIMNNIVVAKNISNIAIKDSATPLKKLNHTNFITISLIVEMKNHIQFLKQLLKSNPEWNITYNIYGPIKDIAYWDTCLELIKQLPDNIQAKYHGFLNPKDLDKAFELNHFFVLPTLGENFGHAILEALSYGKPVILSDKTPWSDIKTRESGWICSDDKAFFDALKEAAEMGNEAYQIMSRNARNHARAFMDNSDGIEAYTRLFNEKNLFSA